MARAPVVLALIGFGYIAYLFGLACVVLAQGIPDETAVFMGSDSPESRVFSFSSLYGLLPLAVVFVSVIVLARLGRERRARRLAVVLLAAGLPFAAFAYFVWYRIGW